MSSGGRLPGATRRARARRLVVVLVAVTAVAAGCQLTGAAPATGDPVHHRHRAAGPGGLRGAHRRRAGIRAGHPVRHRAQLRRPSDRRLPGATLPAHPAGGGGAAPGPGRRARRGPQPQGVRLLPPAARRRRLRGLVEAPRGAADEGRVLSRRGQVEALRRRVRRRADRAQPGQHPGPHPGPGPHARSAGVPAGAAAGRLHRTGGAALPRQLGRHGHRVRLLRPPRAHRRSPGHRGGPGQPGVAQAADDRAGVRELRPNEWWHYRFTAEPYPKRYFDFPVARSSLR